MAGRSGFEDALMVYFDFYLVIVVAGSEEGDDRRRDPSRRQG
jgi:hypothetical protein